jgi:NitT/TauT family transport system ATP-binding protein
MAMIVWENLSKWFFKGRKKIQVLDSLSLEVSQGEFLAVVGPSGCGKSTLLNMTAGLLRPSAGEIYYRETRLQGVNTRVGYITQKDNLFPWRSVEDNIGIALEIRGLGRAQRRDRVAELVQLVGLSGFEKHYPSELSGGMRKRVTLARTLIYDPETLLMDEPFGALDAQLKLILQDELLRLWEATQKTIIFVTHDLTEAVSLANRVVVISARPGRVKMIEKVELPQPRNVFQVRFSPNFGVHFERLWECLREDLRKGEEI